METPISPREFIKRFHLPQLVRIGQDDDGQQPKGSPASRVLNWMGPNGSNFKQVKIQHSNQTTTRATNDRFEQADSDWTYAPGTSRIEQQQIERVPECHSDEDDNETQGDCSDKCRSLHLPDGSANFEVSGARSLRMLPRVKLQQTRSSVQANANLLVRSKRLPLIELRAQHFGEQRTVQSGADQTFTRQSTSAGLRRQTPNRDHQADIKLMPPCRRPTLSKLQLEQPFLLYKAYRKLEVCAYAIDLNNQLNDKSGDPIYFPHNYPGWFSIASDATSSIKTFNTNQQVGSTGAINEQQTGTGNSPFETIDQVCQSSEQIFLTRDELIAYKIPNQLSNLTKLGNNQILAVPLAINLECESGSKKSGGAKSKQQAEQATKLANGKSSTQTNEQRSISDLKQIVIGAGQVLRICGVYEDVLPLIGGPGSNGKQTSAGAKRPDSSRFYYADSQPAGGSHASAMVAPSQFMLQQQIINQTSLAHLPQPLPAQIIYQKQQHHRLGHYLFNQNDNRQVLNQQLTPCGPASAARRNQILIQQHVKNQLASGGGLVYEIQGSQFQANQYQPQIGPAFNLGRSHKNQPTSKETQQPAKSQADKLKSNTKDSNQRDQVAQCRRYARCVVLSDLSLDQMTGCVSGSTIGSKQQRSAPTSPSSAPTSLESSPQEEIEVLIPLNQAGRFYLCATTQTIANELQYHDFSLMARQSTTQMVFRLSQIVYLLNVNKRLSLDEEQQNQWRPFSSIFRVPLQVQLVIGPRPSSFSPTMFGLTSTMESYFSFESNVGGHSLSCAYNKSQQKPTATGVDDKRSRQSTIKSNLNELVELPSRNQLIQTSVCSCPQQVSASKAGGLSWFSGRFRLESVSKRDVLLACTIKQNPLVILDQINEINPTNRLRGTLATTSATKLNDLRESFETLHEAKEVEKQPTASSKSSMNRLRACKSLISLNGRKKKRRPNIPSSMLQLPDALNQYRSSMLDGATGGGGSLNLINRLEVQLADAADDEFGCAQRINQFGRTITGLPSSNKQERIVLIEFDCNGRDGQNNGLKLARTFVEHSLPSSSIPEIVVNRLNFCHRYSSLWERQLKLSNASLSRDFDSCERQLAKMLNPFDGPLKSHNHKQADQIKLAEGDAHQQVTGPTSLMFIEQRSAVASERQFKSQLQSASKIKSSSSHHATGSNSTASSRSSSGVSSSGDLRLKRQLERQTNGEGLTLSAGDNDCEDEDRRDERQRNSATCNENAAGADRSSASSSLAFSGRSSSLNLSASCVTEQRQQQQETSAAKRQGSGAAAAVGGNRLMRLVQRVLPTSSSSSARRRQFAAAATRKLSESSGAACGTPSPNDRRQTLDEITLAELPQRASGQQRRLMEELNGRFKVSKQQQQRPSEDAAAAPPETGLENVKRQRAAKSEEVDCDESLVENERHQAAATTLMNSQKIHQRMRKGDSLRHLPDELLTRMTEADNEFECEEADRLHRHHDGLDQNEDAADDSKSCQSVTSHLYESLERLNESLATFNGRSTRYANRVSGAQSMGSKQQQRTKKLLYSFRAARNRMGSACDEDEQDGDEFGPRPGLGDERPKQEASDEHEVQQAQHSQRARHFERVGSKPVWGEHAADNCQQRRPSYDLAPTSSSSIVSERPYSNSGDDQVSSATSGQQQRQSANTSCSVLNWTRRQKPSRPKSSWRQKLVASVSGGGGGGGGQQKDCSADRSTGRLSYSMELFGSRLGDHDDEQENFGNENFQHDHDRANGPAQQMRRAGAANSRASLDELEMEPVSIEACDHYHHQMDVEGLDNDSKWNSSVVSCSTTSSVASTCASSAASGGGSSSAELATRRKDEITTTNDHHLRESRQRARQSQGSRLASKTTDTGQGGLYLHCPSGDNGKRRQDDSEIYVNLSTTQQQLRERQESSPDLRLTSKDCKLIDRMERKLAKLRGRCQNESRSGGVGPASSACGRRNKAQTNSHLQPKSQQVGKASDDAIGDDCQQACEEVESIESMLGQLDDQSSQPPAQATSSSSCLSSMRSGSSSASLSAAMASDEMSSKELAAGTVEVARTKTTATMTTRAVASDNQNSTIRPMLRDGDDADTENNNNDNKRKPTRAQIAAKADGVVGEAPPPPLPPLHYDHHF